MQNAIMMKKNLFHEESCFVKSVPDLETWETILRMEYCVVWQWHLSQCLPTPNLCL